MVALVDGGSDLLKPDILRAPEEVQVAHWRGPVVRARDRGPGRFPRRTGGEPLRLVPPRVPERVQDLVEVAGHDEVQRITLAATVRTRRAAWHRLERLPQLLFGARDQRVVRVQSGDVELLVVEAGAGHRDEELEPPRLIGSEERHLDALRAAIPGREHEPGAGLSRRDDVGREPQLLEALRQARVGRARLPSPHQRHRQHDQ